MKIFHTSLLIADKPEIKRSESPKKLGQGFYTFTNVDQANIYGEKLCRLSGTSTCYISMYEFDYDNALKDLKVLDFASDFKAWVKFVSLSCKDQRTEDFDIVIGYEICQKTCRLIDLYEAGQSSEQETIEAIKALKADELVVFRSNEALKFLKFKLYMEEASGN